MGNGDQPHRRCVDLDALARERLQRLRRRERLDQDRPMREVVSAIGEPHLAQRHYDEVNAADGALRLPHRTSPV